MVDGGEPGVDSRDEGKQNTEHIFIPSRRCCCFTRYSNIFANSELRRDIITDIHAHTHTHTHTHTDIHVHTGTHGQTPTDRQRCYTDCNPGPTIAIRRFGTEDFPIL